MARHGPSRRRTKTGRVVNVRGYDDSRPTARGRSQANITPGSGAPSHAEAVSQINNANIDRATKAETPKERADRMHAAGYDTFGRRLDRREAGAGMESVPATPPTGHSPGAIQAAIAHQKPHQVIHRGMTGDVTARHGRHGQTIYQGVTPQGQPLSPHATSHDAMMELERAAHRRKQARSRKKPRH